MAAELVCTANIEHRYVCGAICHECRLLVINRRRPTRRWWHWTFNERRKASHWLPAADRFDDDILRDAGTNGKCMSYVWSLVVLLFAFNVFDAILTARALSMGFAEGNPVLAGIFEYSMPLGMAFKSAIVALGCIALWKFRHILLAVRGMAVLTCCYGAVILYHLVFQLSL